MGRKKKIVILLLVFLLVCSFVPASQAQGSKKTVNRFNVVIVVDASRSMITSDPYNLRFQAINQFIYLLADQGNYLGGVVFSTDILSFAPVVPINGQRDKDSKSYFFQSIQPNSSTNIGAALLKATEMLEADGDKNLPSVIVLLSDGNTDMPTDEQQAQSLDDKAEAIQQAREKGISIYSVCLNANQKAEAEEMLQISNATGGHFVEVQKAEDLRDVFNTFYNLIYGTSTITIVDEVFPASGIVEKTFTVPDVGVEEVNIIIYGKTTSVKLYKPSGEDSGIQPSRISSFSMMKLTELIPGEWRIVTTGVPKDQIKINMVYNVDLEIQAELVAAGDTITEGDPAKITAKLISSGIEAASPAQLNGYSAELVILDAYGDPLQTVPMGIEGSHFSADLDLPQGVYKFKAVVNGFQLTRESQIVGPLTILEKPAPVPASPGQTAAPMPTIKPANTAPYAVKTPIQKTVYVFPFKAPSYDLDMRSLAKDKEDAELRYRIESSSFLENTDYTVSDGVIHLYHFSLSKGSFDISATDTGGLSCNIEVNVRRIRVGVLGLIGIGVIGLIVLAVFLIGLWIATTKPIGGPVTVQSCVNGVYTGVKQEKRRGRIYLNMFRMENVGLDYSKCYIQGTGKGYVLLKTNKEVISSNQKGKEIKINSGITTEITISPNDPRRLQILYVCRNKGPKSRGRTPGYGDTRRPPITGRPTANRRPTPPRSPMGRR